MGWNFPTLGKFVNISLNAFSDPPSLALIQEREHVACVISEKNFCRFSIKAVFRVQSGDGLAQALAELEKLCQENGFAQLWQGKVNICLSADAALFLDFHLPSSSRRKLGKIIPLLLDEELPLQPDSYNAKSFLTRDNGYYAIATVVQKRLLQQWRDCLEKFDFTEAEISIFPWPLLKGLPAPGVPSLLICLSPGGRLVCALNAKGAPLRIRQLTSESDDARYIARQTRLLLSDINFKPQSLLFFGCYDSSDLKKAFIEEYGLPARFLGKDLPLSGAYERLGEDDSARILVHCLNSHRLPFLSPAPVFRLEFRRERPKSFPWMLPAALCLALICACEIYSLYNSLNRLSRAESVRTLLLERLGTDLDNVPKNASLGRLAAILDSRLAELENRDAKTGGHFVSLLEDIHKVSPVKAHIGLNRLAYDPKHIRLSGNTDTYEEVNIFKNSLETLEDIETVRIVNAAAVQGSGKARQQIDFELDLVLK